MVESDSSGLKGLTPYTSLCYRCCALFARHLKTRTQMDQAICTTVQPASAEDSPEKKSACPEIFHCSEHTFYIQDF